MEIVIAGMRFALDGPGFCAAQARDVAAAVAAFTGMPKADALDAVVEAYSAALDAAAG